MTTLENRFPLLAVEIGFGQGGHGAVGIAVDEELVQLSGQIGALAEAHAVLFTLALF